MDFGRLNALIPAGTAHIGRAALLAFLCGCGVSVRLSAADFSFAVFGDNQCATGNATSGVPERMALPEILRERRPTFVLHTGDLMDHGRDAEAYVKFVEYYEPLLAVCPFFPTMGNHDAGYDGIRNYKAFLRTQLGGRNAAVYGESYFADFDIAFDTDPTDFPQRYDDPRVKEFRGRIVPSGVSFKTFYSFRFRNAVFVSLEQGTRWWANTPLPWLEDTLRTARAAKGVDHIFVTMHHPMYSTTMREDPPNPEKPASGECVSPVRELYEGLFRTYDVTMVFSGHAHLYEHFVVPDSGEPLADLAERNVFSHEGDAVHYVVTGGGGGPLNKGNWRTEKSAAYSRARLCAYHFIQVDVAGTELDVTVQTVSGSRDSHAAEEFDRFRLVGGRTGGPEPQAGSAE